jgi:PERQ amino acid-rich with GYF domain-containing protein
LEPEENGDLEDRENDVEEPIAPQETFDSLPQTDNLSLLALGGRATSRFSSFGLQDENLTEDDSRAVGSIDQLPAQVYVDDDDVLNDILSMAADPRAMSPSNQMDRLTSRFAAQSLTPNDPSYGAFGVGPFDSEPIRRDSATMSQFFPREAGMPTKAGLFEHPVVPQQQVLPPVPPLTTRVMIMADKLKWVYKDPHGNVQGPFTGLEMHEWYRGGYFHSTLDVKREDDIAFEPLQTLVKRIGNQREPFLVPLPSKTQTQPIPPRSTTTLSGWNTTLFGEGPEEIKQWIAPPPTIQAAALSGTTLTADQQNALERRKQEEQYMLVRQREIAQQQLTHPPVVHPLHHPAPQHPFVASPAFTGFSPMHGLSHGVTHHVHTPAPVQVQTLPALDTLRTGGSLPSTVQPQVPSPMERQPQGGVGFQPPSQGFMSPWGAGPLGPLSPGMSIHQNQETFSTQSYYEEQTASPVEQERRTGVPEVHEAIETPVETSRKSSVSATNEYATIEPPVEIIEPEFTLADEQEIPQETAPTPETEDDLTTTDPPVATPSPARIAPWAQKDEPKKSLSLKQIQEMEAKRAAEQARRVAAERQHLLVQQAAAMPIPVAPQPGLPQGSTWGSVAAKGWTAKPAPATPSPGKKTMAQIQKEEEDERTRLTKGKDVSIPTTAVRGYAGAAAAAAAAKVFPFSMIFNCSLRCRQLGPWLVPVDDLNLVDLFIVAGLIRIFLLLRWRRLFVLLLSSQKL